MDHFIILFVCDLEQTCSPIKEKRNCSPTKIQQRGLNERSRICFSTQKRGVKLQVLRSGTTSCTGWLNLSYSSRLVAIVVEPSARGHCATKSSMSMSATLMLVAKPKKRCAFLHRARRKPSLE